MRLARPLRRKGQGPRQPLRSDLPDSLSTPQARRYAAVMAPAEEKARCHAGGSAQTFGLPIFFPCRTHGTAFGPDIRTAFRMSAHRPASTAPGAGRPPRLTPGRFGLHGGRVRDTRRVRRARHRGNGGARPVPPPEPSPVGGALCTSLLPRVAGRPFRTPLITSLEHPIGAPR
jgi:hypothetical protein